MRIILFLIIFFINQISFSHMLPVNKEQFIHIMQKWSAIEVPNNKGQEFDMSFLQTLNWGHLYDELDSFSPESQQQRQALKHLKSTFYFVQHCQFDELEYPHVIMFIYFSYHFTSIAKQYRKWDQLIDRLMQIEDLLITDDHVAEILNCINKSNEKHGQNLYIFKYLKQSYDLTKYSYLQDFESHVVLEAQAIGYSLKNIMHNTFLSIKQRILLARIQSKAFNFLSLLLATPEGERNNIGYLQSAQNQLKGLLQLLYQYSNKQDFLCTFNYLNEGVYLELDHVDFNSWISGSQVANFSLQLNMIWKKIIFQINLIGNSSLSKAIRYAIKVLHKIYTFNLIDSPNLSIEDQLEVESLWSQFEHYNEARYQAFGLPGMHPEYRTDEYDVVSLSSESNSTFDVDEGNSVFNENDSNLTSRESLILNNEIAGTSVTNINVEVSEMNNETMSATNFFLQNLNSYSCK